MAHIYAYSLGQRDESLQAGFWRRLRFFWSEERVRSWAQAVLGPAGTEIPQNLITLSPTLHKLWGLSRFALKPMELSSDMKTLRVQFFWLPRNTFMKDHKTLTVTDPPSWVNHDDASPLNCKLFNSRTEKKICSGDVITFETKNPITHPLPSWELLDMQWVLHRVVALSGAAEASEEDLDFDDESSLEEGGGQEEEAMELSEDETSSAQAGENQPFSASRQMFGSRTSTEKNQEGEKGGVRESSPLALGSRQTNIR